MLKRIITAIVAIFVLIPILIFSDTWIFPSAVTIVALIAIFEIAGCVGIRNNLRIAIPTYLFTASTTTLSALCYMNIMAKETLLPLLLAVGYVYVFYIFAVTMFSCGTLKISKSAELVAIVLYVLIGFISILMLRGIGPNIIVGATEELCDSVAVKTGKYAYLLIFIGAWTTDTGAYFVGVLFGKHKLIPAVSPKKTIEGAIGGILGCCLGFSVYGLIIDKLFHVEVNYLPLFLLAIPVSVVSQIGDLIASYMKRERGIKDFGFIFPGHGGIMDRFDSIITVAPVIYATMLLLSDHIWFFH